MNQIQNYMKMIYMNINSKRKKVIKNHLNVTYNLINLKIIFNYYQLIILNNLLILLKINYMIIKYKKDKNQDIKI